MAGRSYGQFCGFSRALEIVGERWGLLIVRDLLVAPHRFTDLLHGLPGIPTNVLTARLKELEAGGVVHRRALPRPERGVVYELTPYGRGLEEAVDALGRWGAQRLDTPRPGEVLTVHSMISAMRSTFRADAARGRRFTVQLDLGPVVLHVAVDDGTLRAGPGSLAGADLVVHAGPQLRALMAGEVTPAEALASGIVAIDGDPALLDAFAATFRIDPAPAAATAGRSSRA